MNREGKLIAQLNRAAGSASQGIKINQQIWSGNKQFSDGAPNQFQSLFRVQLEEGHLPFLVTVDRPVLNQFPSTAQGPRMVGRVTWGAGGSKSVAFFDIEQGVTFSVPGSFLEVEAAYEGAVVAPANTFQLSAFAVVGALGKNIKPLYRSSYFTQNGAGGIAAGGAQVFFAPPFARTARVVRRPYAFGGAGQMAIVVPDAVLPEYEIDVAAGNECPQIEMGAGLTGIEVQNTGALTITGRVIWELSL